MTEQELEKLLEEKMERLDKLEENCDTMDMCSDDDGCDRCENLKEMEKLQDEIEGIEDKLIQPEEDELEVVESDEEE